MRTFTKHTVLLQALIAVLFILMSAGFTAILHQCGMADMACCDEMNEVNPSGMESTPLSHPSGDLQLGAPCCENTIIGGLSSTPILLEKQSRPELKLDQNPLVITIDGFASVSDCTRKTTSSSQETASPPSTEKYVLHSALLI